MYKKLGGILGVKTDDTVTSKQKTAILNRMKFYGYKKGSEHIDKSQLAWTQENKRELIYRASDGAVLTKLNPGDKVFTNEMTENLWKLAKTNPSLLYSSTNFVPKLPDIAKSAGTSTIGEVGDIVMTMILKHSVDSSEKKFVRTERQHNVLRKLFLLNNLAKIEIA